MFALDDKDGQVGVWTDGIEQDASRLDRLEGSLTADEVISSCVRHQQLLPVTVRYGSGANVQGLDLFVARLRLGPEECCSHQVAVICSK